MEETQEAKTIEKEPTREDVVKECKGIVSRETDKRLKIAKEALIAYLAQSTTYYDRNVDAMLDDIEHMKRIKEAIK